LTDKQLGFIKQLERELGYDKAAEVKTDLDLERATEDLSIEEASEYIEALLQTKQGDFVPKGAVKLFKKTTRKLVEPDLYIPGRTDIPPIEQALDNLLQHLVNPPKSPKKQKIVLVTRCGMGVSLSGKPFTKESLEQHQNSCHKCQRRKQ